jgi:biotin transport system permease protein/energy-coupling factor transport system permease protein
MVSARHTVFRYKTVKGHLHKAPAMAKLFMLLPLSVFCLSLPPLWLAVGKISAVVTAFLCKFTLHEQITDVKPAFFYAALMYGLSIFSNLFESLGIIPLATLTVAVLIPQLEFLQIAMRLLLIVQLSALLFRTTSSIEIREGLYAIERFARRKLSNLPFFGKYISTRSCLADNISLFLSFIPEIFAIWTSFNLTWKARGGKQGTAKIKTLVLVIIIQSFERAALKSKAIMARE